jgi:hypothetical protein
VDEGPKSLNWTTIALIAGLVLLLIIIAYFATNRDSDQDKLTETEISTSGGGTPEKACSSKAIYDGIKGELFRRAAEIRGSDKAAYEKLSAAAVIRMDNPVMESEDGSTGTINCSGSVSIDLPPGIADGGRRTLMSDIDYSVDASGSVALRNADSIIAPLATLARVAQPPQPAAPQVSNEAAPEGTGTVPVAEPAAPPAGTPTNYPGRPSFNCANARSKSEIAVCNDSGLSALDVNMAAQYRRAINSASPQQQAALQSTRDRFLAYRDRCTSRQCIGDAYVGRMREIRDIMEGHLSPPR